MYRYDKKAMNTVWVIFTVTFVPLAVGAALFTDVLSSPIVPEILFMFSGILVGTGSATLLTIPRRLRKPVALGIILAYGLLIASVVYLLWSLGQEASAPGWLVRVVENPPDVPLPEQLIYGAFGGFLGPAIGRFLHRQRSDQPSRHEAQLALLAIGAGLTLALVVSALFA